MKTFIETKKYGSICYDENIWTNEKKIYINNKECKMIKKHTYIFETKVLKREIYLKGNFFMGYHLLIDKDSILIVDKVRGYEYFLASLNFIMLFLGNSSFIHKYIPVVGGIIGATICLAVSAICLYSIKKIKYKGLKVFSAIFFLLLDFLLCYGIGSLIVRGFN